MLGGTAGHSSKNRYCPARFGTVDRYGVVTENIGQSDTEREEGHVYLRTRMELECHIGLMDETGVFHRLG